MITTKRNGYYLVKATDDRKLVPLACIADVHCGHRNFSPQHLNKIIKWIQDNDAYWFGGGDLIECSTKTSVGAGWAEQSMTPQEQLDYMTEALMPIAEKCIGMVNGNHEDRAFKTTGINPTQILCNALRVPYAGDELFGIIGLDRTIAQKGKTYTLYACHTKTSNKTSGLAFNGLHQVEQWMAADIICKGHGHDMGLSPPNIAYEIDTQNMAITTVERYMWLVGHYLERQDSYIAKASGRPKPIGTIALWLDMDYNKPKRINGEYVR